MSFLAHGLGLDPVEPDWPPLNDEEVGSVLSCLMPELEADVAAVLVWRSPRPFSAAGLVQLGGPAGCLFVKRHSAQVRSLGAIELEHSFARHLRSKGVPAAAPIAARSVGQWVYEAHEAAPGTDLYREALSWTPYLSPGHARAAGGALAQFHAASADFEAPAREVAPLTAWPSIVASDDLDEAIVAYAGTRPAVGAYLSQRPWRDEVLRVLEPWHRPLRGLGVVVSSIWGHNDWHPSNLMWTGPGADGKVSGIIDFGLANRTTVVYDIATAIERSVIEWLQPAARRPVHLDHMQAFLEGYQAVRRLDIEERILLPRLLPLVHVEYALSEVDYFSGILGSAANADVAYGDYLLGHAQWFESPTGAALLGRLGHLLSVGQSG